MKDNIIQAPDDLGIKNLRKKLINRNAALFIVYMVIITVLTLAYDYPETLMKRPQSIHNWRQCDGSSIALNYYQEGMHFFRPQTHMLYSDGYTTGYAAPSEIPILYYFVAILYKIFGYHEFIFRMVNLLIFFIGLFYLFRLADSVLHDVFYAAVVTLLIFSAPVLVYYANNFMPNTVALSFSFIGWYYFYDHCKCGKTKTFLLSMLFFGFAGAMKITELVGPIIILGLLIAERLKIFSLNIHSGKNPGLKVFSILSIFVIVGGWIIYARHYNSLHGSIQFMTYPIPIWKMSKTDIDAVLHLMNVLWFKDYFYPATFWFMIAGLFVLVIWWKRSDKILRLVCIVEIMALIAFSLMWFMGLGDHDYFYIGFYIVPALLFINFFAVIKNLNFSKVNLSIIRFVFLAVVVINVYYAQERHSLRYYRSWMNDFEQQKDLYTITPWLNESGISKNDTVIFYPSRYIRPLYLMNVKGWTIFEHDTAVSEVLYRDSSQMSLFTSKGAEYFITNDIKSAVNWEPFKPYMKDLYAKYNSIFIFRLPPQQNNFNPADSLLLAY
jgi:hypothetical protein